MFSWCNPFRGDQAEPSLIPANITMDKVAVAGINDEDPTTVSDEDGGATLESDQLDSTLSECSEEPETTPSASPALSVVSTDLTCPKEHKTTELSRLNWNDAGLLWEDETAMMVTIVREYYDEGFGPWDLGDTILHLVFGFVTDPLRFVNRPYNYVKDFPDAWRFWRSRPRQELLNFLISNFQLSSQMRIIKEGYRCKYGERIIVYVHVKRKNLNILVHGLWMMYLRRQKKAEIACFYGFMYDRFITAFDDSCHGRTGGPSLKPKESSIVDVGMLLDFVYDNETHPFLNVPAKKH